MSHFLHWVVSEKEETENQVQLTCLVDFYSHLIVHYLYNAKILNKVKYTQIYQIQNLYDYMIRILPHFSLKNLLHSM